MSKTSWKRLVVAATAGCLVISASFAEARHGRRRCRCQSALGCGLPFGPLVPDALGPGANPGPGPALAGPAGYTPEPPPGTLGKTYLRQTVPVPAAKHPRAGLLDVRAPGASSVSVQWTNPYKLEDELNGFVDAREEALWHFESAQPVPGVPLIYRVEARYGTGDDCTVREKYVRLVMGRVVNVTF